MASILKVHLNNLNGNGEKNPNPGFNLGLAPGATLSSLVSLASSFLNSNVGQCEPSLKEVLERLEKLENKVAPKSPHGVDVVLGAQWGDEGKGKLVDQLTGSYDVCARVAGGSNAGHTIVVDGVKYKFHLVPSGMLNPRAQCVVGNGVVVHVPSLLREVAELEKAGVAWRGRLFLSDRAHIVFDFHQEVDARNETKLGRHFIGTTKKGIGPAYSSKINRNGVRFGDLQDWPEFERKVRTLAGTFQSQYPNLKLDVEKELDFYRGIRSQLLEMTVDTIELVNRQHRAGKRILIEGANATMLDIDFGTYPYVTSSNPSVGSICTGLGVSPTKIRQVWGVCKAYCTRVGEGPFPTELLNKLGEHLRDVGGEFGTTTGRPRRCGWLDVPQMRYSTTINGFDALMLTKLDCLTGMDEVKIGVRYTYKGKALAGMPSNLKILSDVVVEYETLPGWKEDISGARRFEDLPEQAQAYVNRVEQLIGTPVKWIGVGPSREAVIEREV